MHLTLINWSESSHRALNVNKHIRNSDEKTEVAINFKLTEELSSADDGVVVVVCTDVVVFFGDICAIKRECAVSIPGSVPTNN
ncbi:unnamed protein product [Anisakis simplex]|uniref:Uncharacterized protein n=1 Tax=Anisakis simplex TaxID=6269 RepID=A0A0M3J7J7_ANISI|nr:unnamed protein product [Anisakis simplex]